MCCTALSYPVLHGLVQVQCTLSSGIAEIAAFLWLDHSSNMLASVPRVIGNGYHARIMLPCISAGAAAAFMACGCLA